ncbi:MAG: glycosyltransferase family 2 protein [Chloroflexi bacterium]|nr:glycosyltransferase family 2 protein [Chloroflexota bacterium]
MVNRTRDLLLAEPESALDGTARGRPASLSVVIPALNEENGIDAILQRVLAQREGLAQVGIRELEVIVVDDGSKDKTADRIRTYSDVRLIQHEVNKGYGAALKTGFNAATGDLLAFLDADGTYPPESFPALCQAVEEHGADLIIGSRMLSGESEMPLVRRVGNTIFAALLSIVGSRRISDSASGMRVFHRDMLPILYPLPDGLDFTPAMSTRAVYEGLKMVEVPIPYKERVGRSKLNPLKDGIRFLRSILWTALLYDPQRFFSTFGLGLLIVAFLLGLGPTIYYAQNRHLQEDMIYRLFAVLILSVAGVNLLAFGVTCQAILGLLPARRRPPPAVPRPWRGRLAGIGVIMVILGMGLMTPAALQWLATRQITAHWSYFAAGGTLVLTGLGLATWFILLLILQELTTRDARARRDLSA